MELLLPLSRSSTGRICIQRRFSERYSLLPRCSSWRMKKGPLSFPYSVGIPRERYSRRRLVSHVSLLPCSLLGRARRLEIPLIDKTSRRFSRFLPEPLSLSLSSFLLASQLPRLPKLSPAFRRLWSSPSSSSSNHPSSPPSPPSPGISTLILRLTRAFCAPLFALRSLVNVILAKWLFFFYGTSFNLETRSSVLCRDFFVDDNDDD